MFKMKPIKQFVAPKILTYNGSQVDPVNRTVYTFAGTAIGDAAYDRRVIVCVSQGSGAPSTNVTVGGITADLLIESTDGGVSGVTIWIALVPTGTTADIVVTTGSSSRLGIGVWSCTGLKSNTPIDTDASDSVRSADMSVATSDGGFAVAVTNCRNNTGTVVAWTGMTERYDQTQESMGNYQSGADAVDNDGTTLDVNAYYNRSDCLTYASAIASF